MIATKNTSAGSKLPNGTGERRITERTCCMIPASISANGFQENNVIVRDISSYGMRLYAPGRKWLPETFCVVCEELGQPINVLRIWSEPPYFGVRFLQPGQAI